MKVCYGCHGFETDMAFVWLPLPAQDRYAWTVVAEEPRLVALPDTHPLASRPEIDFTDLAEEPFAVHDGVVAIPDRPGLGVTVRDDFVERYRHRPPA